MLNTRCCVSFFLFFSWNVIQEGNITYKDMDRMELYKKGLNTWAKWADSNLNSTKTRVFFQGVSPDHEG